MVLGSGQLKRQSAVLRPVRVDHCFSVFSKHDHHAISVVPLVMENAALVGSNVSFDSRCIETAIRKYHLGLDGTCELCRFDAGCSIRPSKTRTDHTRKNQVRDE